LSDYHDNPKTPDVLSPGAILN